VGGELGKRQDLREITLCFIVHINLFAQVFFAANMFVMTLFCAYRRLFSPVLLASIFFFSALPFAALFIYGCMYVWAGLKAAAA